MIWHSVKTEGYPVEEGTYLVTVEGVIDGMDGKEPDLGERCVTVATYYGKSQWGLQGGICKVVAWSDLLEAYRGE